MKKILISVFLMSSLFGCGESTNTNNNPPDLKKEIQSQNQPNISINEKLSQSQTVLVCGDKLYEVDNGVVRFYQYMGLGSDNNPIYKVRNPSIVGPMNYDSTTSTYTWKVEYKVLDKDVTSVEQLLVNDQELLMKDSMTNQVNKISCMTFEDFSQRFKMLSK